MSLLKDFKEFAMKGNVLDMAVGVVIGAAFGKIITSLVNDIIMPPIGMLIGHVNFKDLVLELHDPLADGEPVLIKYGAFINTLLDFLIVAFAIFVVVSQLKRLRRKEETSPEPTTKACPYCQSTIAIKATRCPSCTSQL